MGNWKSWHIPHQLVPQSSEAAKARMMNMEVPHHVGKLACPRDIVKSKMEFSIPGRKVSIEPKKFFTVAIIETIGGTPWYELEELPGSIFPAFAFEVCKRLTPDTFKPAA